MELMKKPPSNIRAEQALLGAIINDNYILEELMIKDTDFYKQSHIEIFLAIKELIKDKKKVDSITLSEQLGDTFETVGGFLYINDLTTEGIITDSFKHWEKIVIDNSVLRQQINIATEIRDLAYNGINAIDKVKLLLDVENHVDGEIKFISEFINETMDDIDEYLAGNVDPGIMTKIKGLDLLLNGLKNGDLIYIGARPSMGKSALATQIVLNIAENNKSIAFFSLEMQDKKIAKRMLVNQSRVHLNMIRDKMIDSDQRSRMLQSASKLFNTKIAISDKGGQTVSDIVRKAKRHKQKHGLDILFIDHFHLLKSDGKFNSTYERRSHDSQALKEAAMELGIPVVVLCQLSRTLESRSINDRMPILSDLRETGSLEQDGDVVAFIDRPDYWHKNEYDYKPNHKANVSVAKNRDGETGIFELNWSGGIQRFDNI